MRLNISQLVPVIVKCRDANVVILDECVVEIHHWPLGAEVSQIPGLSNVPSWSEERRI